MQEILGRIIEKHGPWAAFCIGLLVILWFVGRQFVKALDKMSANAATIATAVNDSSRAQIRAFAALTDRVSRVEGKLEGLGLAALGQRQAFDDSSVRRAIGEHAEQLKEYDDTPVETPRPPLPSNVHPLPHVPRPRVATPAKGSPTYRPPQRPPTVDGKKGKP